MSTGTDAGPIHSFSSREPEINYRPVSQMAVTCLCLGVLSFLAFAHLLFWILPPITLILAIRTSAQLEAAKREYAGQFLAKIAIFLALVSGIGAVTRYIVQRVIITNEARNFANEYLDMVLANEIKNSFVLTVRPLQRSGLENAPDQLLTRVPDQYRSYIYEDALVKQLGGKGAEAQIINLGTSGFEYADSFFHLAVLYRVILENDTFDVVLHVAGGSALYGSDWEGRKWYVVRSEIRKAEPPKE